MIAIRPAKDVGCSSDGGVGIGELEKISKIFDVFWRYSGCANGVDVRDKGKRD